VIPICIARGESFDKDLAIFVETLQAPGAPAAGSVS
jgi:hypothetical protein